MLVTQATLRTLETSLETYIHGSEFQKQLRVFEIFLEKILELFPGE